MNIITFSVGGQKRNAGVSIVLPEILRDSVYQNTLVIRLRLAEEVGRGRVRRCEIFCRQSNSRFLLRTSPGSMFPKNRATQSVVSRSHSCSKERSVVSRRSHIHTEVGTVSGLDSSLPFFAWLLLKDNMMNDSTRTERCSPKYKFFSALTCHWAGESPVIIGTTMSFL